MGEVEANLERLLLLAPVMDDGGCSKMVVDGEKWSNLKVDLPKLD